MSNDDLLHLRDTLLTALQTYHAGPRTILVQLCLAISALALQFPGWEDPMETMIQSFGKNPTYVPAMLQFLTILPEEVTSNTKIPITVSGPRSLVGARVLSCGACMEQDDEYKERAAKLLTMNSLKVIELLSAYLQAPGEYPLSLPNILGFQMSARLSQVLPSPFRRKSSMR